MSYNHVVVWIDHTEAHVIHFTAEASESEVVKTHSTHSHLHSKAAGGSGHAPENKAYLHDVSVALGDSSEILIVGPGAEKLEFMKYLQKQNPAQAERVMGLESVDHPTDGALLKYARKYVVRADLLKP